MRLIEFDVQLSRDGELVLMHDAEVGRTTNSRSDAGRLTFAELRSLSAGMDKLVSRPVACHH